MQKRAALIVNIVNQVLLQFRSSFNFITCWTWIENKQRATVAFQSKRPDLYFSHYIIQEKKLNNEKENSISIRRATRMGFEPTRAEHIKLVVQRLNHSATSSDLYGKGAN